MYLLKEGTGMVSNTSEQSKHLTVAARGRAHGLPVQFLADDRVNTFIWPIQRGEEEIADLKNYFSIFLLNYIGLCQKSNKVTENLTLDNNLSFVPVTSCSRT